jgi:hypothetical protein
MIGVIPNKSEKMLALLYKVFQYTTKNRSVGIVTDWTAGVRFSTPARDFSLLHSIQTGSGAHTTSHPIQWVLGVLSPNGKATRVFVTDHSPMSS